MECFGLNIVKMLENVVVIWRNVGGICWMRQNLVSEASGLLHCGRLLVRLDKAVVDNALAGSSECRQK